MLRCAALANVLAHPAYGGTALVDSPRALPDDLTLVIQQPDKKFKMVYLH